MNFAMDFADDFVVDDPLTFCYFLEGNLLRISSGLELILGIFCFTKFVVLEISRDDFTEFSVIEFFWNRHNPLFL